MQSAFDEKKRNGSKRLVEFQYNMRELTKIADEIFVYLKERFERDTLSLNFFDKEYSWFSRSYYETYSYLSLQEIIDYDEYLNKNK